MAFLTKKEMDELFKKGIIVSATTEKCDNCEKIITSLPYHVGKHQETTLCSMCYTGSDLVNANLIEENRMKKKLKEKKEAGEGKRKKIGGAFILGTAIADLYQFLEDEKKHTLKDAIKSMAKHKADKMGRIKQMQRAGKKKGLFALVIDEAAGTIQLKLGVKAAATEKKEKEEKKTVKVKGKEKEKEEEKENEDGDEVEEEDKTEKEDESEDEDEDEDDGAKKSEKGKEAVAKLVRRTLKAGKDWTKNKLADHLNEKHDIDVKDALAAISAEIKAGGIMVEDQILILT